jgi:hypothetical protein
MNHRETKSYNELEDKMAMFQARALAAEAQRDALLAACKRAFPYVHYGPAVDALSDAIDAAEPRKASPRGESEAQQSYADKNAPKEELLDIIKQLEDSLSYWFKRYGDPQGCNSQMMVNARAIISKLQNEITLDQAASESEVAQ